MDTPFSSASSDLAIRCFGPPFVAEAYRNAVATVGDSRDLLSRRIGFVDVVLRFLTAVLASELHAVGGDLPSEYRNLLAELHKPSIGHWSKAAYELAKALHGSGHAAVCDGFLSFWLDRRPKKDVRRSSAGNAIQRICELRNEVAHDGCGPVCSAAVASTHLRERDGEFRCIAAALRFFRESPLFMLDESIIQGGRISVRVQKLQGSDTQSTRVLLDTVFPVDQGEVFLLGRDGRCLSLSPFVVVRQIAGDVAPTARLFAKWDTDTKQFLYSGTRDAISMRPGSESQPDSPIAAVSALTKAGNRPRLNDATVVQLLDPAISTALPRLADYEIEARIGAGCSGTVYRARMTSSGAPVAIKLLHPEVVSDPQQRRRLADEYRVMRELSAQHVPGIATVHTYGEVSDYGPYFVMEWLAGNDLDTDARLEPHSPAKAVNTLRPVLQALQAAHERGIFHRDIKPANILLDSDGNGRLIDFGIAKSAALHATRTLESIGTMAFAAPEQLFGGKASATADIFAVGKTLSYLLTGHIGPSCHDTTPLPPSLVAVIRQATHKVPERRFPSARAMLDALMEAADAHFDGPPVLVGEAIADSYEVAAIEGEIAPGIWCLGGRERATDKPVGLLLAATEDADRLLLERVRTIDTATEIIVGLRATLSAEGRTVCVYAGDRVRVKGCRLFGVPDAPTKGTTAGAQLAATASGIESVWQSSSDSNAREASTGGMWRAVKIGALLGGPIGAFVGALVGASSTSTGDKRSVQAVTIGPENATAPGRARDDQDRRPRVLTVGSSVSDTGASVPDCASAAKVAAKAGEEAAPQGSAPPAYLMPLLVSIARPTELLQGIRAGELTALVLGALMAELAKQPLGEWPECARTAGQVGNMISRLAGGPGPSNSALGAGVWGDAAKATLKFANLRNHIVHKRGDNNADLQAVTIAVVDLIELMLKISASRGPVPPVPWIRLMEDGKFAILSPFGRSLRYEALELSEEGKFYPLPSDVVEDLAREERPSLASSSRAVESRAREAASEAEARAISEAERWPFVGSIARPATAQLHGRTVTCDALVLDGAGTPIAVLEVVSFQYWGNNRLNRLDSLWGMVCAFRCPFGILSDGNSFKCFRADANDGLVEVGLDDVARQAKMPAT